MTKVACRSSNLIYCLTCKRCGIQYIGQTSLRIIDRIGKYFYDIGLYDLSKTVSKHFSHHTHNGNKDIEISVLEFIKKAPKSPVALIIRNRVERRWIHLMRTMAPLGLNLED